MPPSLRTPRFGASKAALKRIRRSRVSARQRRVRRRVYTRVCQTSATTRRAAARRLGALVRGVGVRLNRAAGWRPVVGGTPMMARGRGPAVPGLPFCSAAARARLLGKGTRCVIW